MPSEKSIPEDKPLLEKSASALKTIGEAAEILDIPQHVLRFWEKKIHQLAPVKRRGRRYYRPEDMECLQQIKFLLYKEGYTIKGVQKFLAQSDPSLAGNTNQPDLFVQPASAAGISTSHLAIVKEALVILLEARQQLEQALSK